MLNQIGFTSGHDWGWDSPHLQYDKIKYGKDTYGKIKVEPTVKEDDELKLTSNTLKTTLEKLLNDDNLRKQIIERAIKELKYNESWRTKKTEDGDILSMAYSLILKDVK